MCQIHLLKHSPRVSDQEVWGGAQELAFLASSHVMLVPMPILLVTDHTMRTTATEHLRVAIVNSPKRPLHRMQWNKLRKVYIYIFFYSYRFPPPPLIRWLIKMLFLVLRLCGLKKYVTELIRKVSHCTSVTFSENIVPEKSINTTHKPLSVLHTWHAREWKKTMKCKKWSVQRPQSELKR